ncbi:DNA replication protein DnaD, partial [Staphylococcus aureus]|nr:DNA replication protein DnaD [Staphylococcus aureus]
ALDVGISLYYLSFNYMDRFFLNWMKNNVKTIDDSRNIREKFNKPKMTHTFKTLPKFDWLNGENLDGK